jgi:hopanoid-associated phosphorylase
MATGSFFRFGRWPASATCDAQTQVARHTACNPLADILVSETSSVLVVTGLAVEARIAAGPGITTICSGGDPDRLRELLEPIDPRSLRAVVSFGLAGGLDPSLRAGDIVIAKDVLSGTTQSPTHEGVMLAFVERLARGRVIAVPGSIVGSDAVVADPAAKAALHETGFVAVDMESHVAAEFAAMHRLPLGVVRVICDSAQRRLPPLVGQALGTQGRIDLSRIMGSLARNPAQLSSLFGTGRDFAAALASLRRSRRLLGLGFGLVDAGDLLLDVP